MNFLLNNLELELDENLLLLGEKLFEEGKVLSLQENERHLWIAEVDLFEVEIQISPSRVKAFTCTCETFRQQNLAPKSAGRPYDICPHIAAGLLALRRKLSEKKDTQPVFSPKTNDYKKLTVSAILENVSAETLNNFIRQYAKSNSAFLLALKTRFAASVPMHDPLEKYRQIIEDFLTPARKKNDRLGPAGIRQVVKMTTQLTRQAEDALALENYIEVYAIAAALIERISLVLRRSDGDSQPLYQVVTQGFSVLEKLLELPVSPDLQETIWSFCVGECGKSVYRNTGFSAHLYRLMLLFVKEPEKAEQLWELLESEWVKPYLTDDYRLVLTGVRLRLVEANEASGRAKDYWLDLLSKPELLPSTILIAHETGLLSIARRLLEQGLRLTKDDAIQQQLRELAIEVAVSEGDSAQVYEIAEKLFLQTFDLAHYKLIKEHRPTPWNREFIVTATHRLGDKALKLNTLADVYVLENDWEALADLLKENLDLDFLQRNDKHLIEALPDRVLALYQTWFERYLTEHFGIKPIETIQQVLAHLRKYGAWQLAARLSNWLREAYPERMAMTDHLQLLPTI